MVLADGQRVAERLGIFIRRLGVDVALGADDAEIGDAVGVEAGGERREPIAVETQQARRHLVDLRHVRSRAVDRRGEHRRRLRAEHQARGVDAVDAEVVERAAAELALGADAARLGVHRERRAEVARLADLARANDVEHLEKQRLEVQAVGGHDLDVGLLGRLDHAVALLLRHRQRLLAQHVLAGLGGAHHVVLVLGVGRADVDGVDFLQHAVVVVVAWRAPERGTCRRSR